MRTRLVSDELVALYTSGQSAGLTNGSIRCFFGVLEAVEASASEDDLSALRSVARVATKPDRLAFSLGDNHALIARRERDSEGQVVIAFTGIEHDQL